MNELVWLFFVLGIDVGMLVGFLLTAFLWDYSERRNK